MGVLELFPLDQVSSNCVLKVHQIEAFYFKNVQKHLPGGAYPRTPLEEVMSTPQLNHVHTILNTFETILTYITYVNTFLFLSCRCLL